MYLHRLLIKTTEREGMHEGCGYGMHGRRDVDCLQGENGSLFAGVKAIREPSEGIKEQDHAQ